MYHTNTLLIPFLPFALCCPTPSADTVVRFSELGFVFGLPKAIRSDQGSAFNSQLSKQWCSTNGVQHHFSPVRDQRGSEGSSRRGSGTTFQQLRRSICPRRTLRATAISRKRKCDNFTKLHRQSGLNIKLDSVKTVLKQVDASAALIVSNGERIC